MGKRFLTVCCALVFALSLVACGGDSSEGDVLATLAPASEVDVESLLPEELEAARLALERRCQVLGLQAEVSFDAEKVCYTVRGASEEASATRLAQLNRTADFSVTEDDAGKEVLLSEADIASVSLEEDGGQYQLRLTLTDEAKARWAEATRRLSGKQTYIWLDHTLFLKPTISAEVTDGSLVLAPFFTESQAAGMAAALSAELPFQLEVDLPGA